MYWVLYSGGENECRILAEAHKEARRLLSRCGHWYAEILHDGAIIATFKTEGDTITVTEKATV